MIDVTQTVSLSLVIFSLVATIFWFIYRYLETNNVKKFKKRNVEYVNYPSQLLAMLKKKQFHLMEKREIEKHGSVFGFNLFLDKTIIVAEPELLQIVFNKEFTNFTNRRKFVVEDPIQKKFMFVSEDEEWKRLRSVVTPVFSAGKLRQIKYIIDDTANTLLKNLETFTNKSKTINVKQLMGGFTMDTIIQVGFGVKVDSLVDIDNPIIKHAKKLFSTDLPLKELVNTGFVILLPKLAHLLGIRLNAEEIDFFQKMALDIIDKKRKELEGKKTFGKGKNLIEIMLEAEAEGQLDAQNDYQKRLKYITNDEIIAQSISFFIVGYDTTASTISSACYLLALNPDKQEKLFEEIIKVIEELKNESEDNETDPFKLVSFDSLPRFKYLDAVINEALRLLGPVATVERRAAKDIVLATEDGRISINVKKDDVIRVPIYTIHHSERFYKDAESFVPERFLNSNDYNKFAFMPFGLGPRRCLATLLAQLEVKLALIHTIRNYKLTKAPNTKVPLDFFVQFDIQIAKEICLTLHKR